MITGTKRRKTSSGSESRASTDVRDAVEIAIRAFYEFYPDLVSADVRLEELEKTEDGKAWIVTLGYDAKRKLSPHQKAFQTEEYRAYKTFQIDKATGAVLSMKIRSIE